MTLANFLEKFNFKKNPFLHSNADKEEKYLEQYFVKPNYFEEMWGDHEDPVSNIMYAPRGGGKTAQRLMFEKRGQEKKYNNLLIIKYTDHNLSNYKTTKEIDQSYHLIYLNRLMLLSFLNHLYSVGEYKYLFEFNYNERQYIYQLCKIYLYNTPKSFPKHAISSIKTLEDRLVDIWRNFKDPLSEIIKVISTAKGAEIDISKMTLNKKVLMSHRDNFLNIKDLLSRVGLKSIYFLIDKVDEQSITGNDPIASYEFIAPILKDLELLETPGIGFKFFLWDQLIPFCAESARPDRIRSYKYEWNYDSLRALFNKRIAVFSDNRYTDATNIYSDENSLGRHIVFSQNSPRDLIRIGEKVLSEQFNTNRGEYKFQRRTVNTAIEKFCEEKALELLKGNESYLKILKRLNSVSFVLEEIYEKSNTLKILGLEDFVNNLQSQRLLKVINKSTIISKIPAYEYAFSDVCLARVACKSSSSLESFIYQKIRDCSRCGVFSYRNFDHRYYQCLECDNGLNPEKKEKLIGSGDNDLFKKVEYLRDRKIQIKDEVNKKTKKLIGSGDNDLFKKVEFLRDRKIQIKDEANKKTEDHNQEQDT
ncbi:MAG: hypothetical protein AAGF96_04390 [Bacteroidota bacterium]